MMFAVATAACLYYTGDYVGGSTLERVIKVFAIRASSFLVASVIMFTLGFRTPQMALMGGCCYSGGSPSNLFSWTEFCQLPLVLPMIFVLRTIRQVGCAFTLAFQKQNLWSPRQIGRDSDRF